MKITKRIAEEQFCFTEIEFDSLEEYQKEYPKFAVIHSQIKLEAKKRASMAQEPFENNHFKQ